MTSLLTRFISEARGLLEQASADLLALEKAPDDQEVLNSLFRCMHTLKGSSGVVEGLDPLTRAVHAGEDLLDDCRGGKLSFSANLADPLFDTVDLVGEWLDALGDTGALPDDAGRVGAALANTLRGLRADSPEAAAADTPAPVASADHCDWLRLVDHGVRRDMYIALSAPDAALIAFEYVPDPQCFFVGDDPLLTARTAPDLVWRGVEPAKPWDDDLAAFDPFACNLRMRGLGTASLDAYDRHFAYVINDVRLLPVARAELVTLDGPVAGAKVFEPFSEDARGLVKAADWDGLRAAVATMRSVAGGTDGFEGQALDWLDLVLNSGPIDPALVNRLVMAIATGRDEGGETGPAPMHPSTDTPAGPPGEPRPAPALDPTTAAAADILMAQLEALAMPMPPDQRLAQLPSRKETLVRVLTALDNMEAVEKLTAIVHQARREEDAVLLAEVARDMLMDLGVLEPDAETASVAPANVPSGGAPTARKPAEAPSTADRRGRSTKPKLREIKVDQERIDSLMDLAGELVVAKNALPFLARRADVEFGVRDLAREIKGQHQTLNRIVEDLQGAVMQVRMVPVSAVFGAFPRLVRDYARKLDKKIRLVVEGEDTEADKNVIEDLSDPLIHLIRNSIDHGLEPADERVAAGKSEEGTIELRAYQEEDRVVIEVNDDGRGIDADKLKAKAIEKGVITAEAAADLSETDALNLIFAPGFSTAEKVSDLSGRGVGMDVVRVALERAGGTIKVSSTLGQGTRVRLSLPLAMAISRVMMTTLADQPFGIPMDYVVETVRIRRSDIHHIKDREATVLRGRVVPLRRLRSLLGIETVIDVWDSGGVLEEAVLVVNDGSGHTGLVVDDFEENVEVILKPMEGIMARFGHYSGTALLGDGRVLLVLNLREILKWP
ncbi:chemotaxis protein CheA [Rhodospira trueperi]|uniref:Chemotaxis protein CheA n=1 Tax=Rhodospira trueperi TaxID=69960 RepID=A0A1G7HB66_9PROT|nr:chemotaxis protein CheA [Rhodospira trueperi]SDE97534.1 two-component system, chemotaxis family, sensor kinase CheA [Rhodospira trueperi]